ncbi:hypothetical protein F4821DRAFT_70351 [Hypoxylon rubiginosum]|uniref:Uncharacterized protein n=1 Tax=Hypoxylon rubiginosum TaxID=110542 RepID=A0ACC0D8W5_9PEZI|nr:hypothetical protein F4821DRAFT_70351 [Hypoxylon rubiginosum]
MQFTLGRSAHSHHHQSRQVAAKPDSHKQSYTKQSRYGKSQPFDPDDLRQRLQEVIAEQEASKERQRRERLEAAKLKQAQAEVEKVLSTVPNQTLSKPEDTETNFAARMARNETTAKSSEAKVGRSMSKSIHDKLRRKPSKMEATATENTVRPPSSYHHVPQEAASQFARTATSTGMLDKHLVHSLSQSALKYHKEGRVSDLVELDSSTTPAQQARALKRAQSHRDKLHERNQFQQPRAVADERGSSEEGRHHIPNHRRSVSGLAHKPSSRRKNSFGNIPEDETLRSHPAAAVDSPINELASEETLVVDPAAANEHRVDWTQSDETYEKPRSVKNPLLRKADSIWTLKGRLGNLTKNSQSRDEKKFTPREKHMEGSAPSSPPKSHRLALFARLRR